MSLLIIFLNLVVLSIFLLIRSNFPLRKGWKFALLLLIFDIMVAIGMFFYNMLLLPLMLSWIAPLVAMTFIWLFIEIAIATNSNKRTWILFTIFLVITLIILFLNKIKLFPCHIQSIPVKYDTYESTCYITDFFGRTGKKISFDIRTYPVLFLIVIVDYSLALITDKISLAVNKLTNKVNNQKY